MSSAVTIRAAAPLYPSEDPAKVENAVCNVFDGKLVRQRHAVLSEAAHMSSLDLIRDAIRTGAESSRAYRRNMLENLSHDVTWFYLNKQAAFAGRVAICHQADESPLGPIKITIDSADPEGVMDRMLAHAS